MRVDASGHREFEGHQHRRPDDRVEPEDFLADDVERRRPVTVAVIIGIRKVECGGIVQKGIDPDVDHVLFITGERNAPSKIGGWSANSASSRS